MSKTLREESRYRSIDTERYEPKGGFDICNLDYNRALSRANPKDQHSFRRQMRILRKKSLTSLGQSLTAAFPDYCLPYCSWFSYVVFQFNPDPNNLSAESSTNRFFSSMFLVDRVARFSIQTSLGLQSRRFRCRASGWSRSS